MIDAMIASALKKLSNTHVHFRQRVNVEEQRAQKYDRFLRGRQIAHMIDEHFCASGANEPVQGLSDLFNIRLHNDDVQDFDTRWDQALLSANEIPTEMVLEGLYKPKLQDSVQLQTVLTLYDQETPRNNEQTIYSRLKTSVRLHVDQVKITRNFRVRNEVVERGAVTWSQKRKPTLRGKWENVFIGTQMDNFQKETHVVSVMNWLRETVAEARDQKDNRPLPHQIRRSRLTAREKILSKESGNKHESFSDKRSKIPCRYRNCNNPSCGFWHPPVCQNYKSKTGCTCCNNFSDMLRLMGSQQKVEAKLWERFSCHVEGVYTIGLCISRILSEKIYSSERRTGTKSHRQVLQRHVAPKQNSGEEGSITRHCPKV